MPWTVFDLFGGRTCSSDVRRYLLLTLEMCGGCIPKKCSGGEGTR